MSPQASAPVAETASASGIQNLRNTFLYFDFIVVSSIANGPVSMLIIHSPWAPIMSDKSSQSEALPLEDTAWARCFEPV